MRFRPCIDLHSGKVKQIVGSTLTDNKGDTPITNFETDRPSYYYAALYRDDRLPGGHVIMLGAGNSAAANDALRAYPGGLQVGVGITADNAHPFIDNGASHVIVTSFVFSGGAVRWENLDLLEKVVGKQRIVLDLSCRRIGDRYVVACDRWQNLSGIELSSDLLAHLAKQCDEFLVHAVDVEGKRQGIDAELVRFLAAASPIPATYAGGIRSIDDMEAVRQEGNGLVDATIGSALDIFGGALKYREVVAWQWGQEKTARKTP
jgi:phosphoribosylformimino-5-aminoimidazole carboxamide ribotide isomerase